VENLLRAVKFSSQPYRKLGLTALFSASLYCLMVLLSFPGYSFQMLSTNPLLLFEAVSALTWNLEASGGLLAVVLTAVYAAFGGVASTILVSNVSSGGAAGGLAPGLAVSGCASCGTGVLGLVGLGGALGSLPFDGNLVRLGGIGLLAFFLARTGDPELCELNGE
jgi:hypothetical protein